MARVYIVEDDKDLQVLYKLYLSKMGHEIVGISYDGEEALIDLFCNYSANPPDIIILDHNMPNKTGLELLEDLQDLNYNQKTKILLITAESNLQHQASELGVSKYIMKPLKLRNLDKMIREVITNDDLDLHLCT